MYTLSCYPVIDLRPQRHNIFRCTPKNRLTELYNPLVWEKRQPTKHFPKLLSIYSRKIHPSDKTIEGTALPNRYIITNPPDSEISYRTGTICDLNLADHIAYIHMISNHIEITQGWILYNRHSMRKVSPLKEIQPYITERTPFITGKGMFFQGMHSQANFAFSSVS